MESDPTKMAERIRWLYGQLVILDFDLAELLGVAQEQLNTLFRERWSPVKKEFAFSIGPNDLRHLDPCLDNVGSGDGTNTWLVYTEHGVLVAGSILDTPEAVQQSIALVREFVAKRERAEARRKAQPQQWLH